MSKRNYSAPYKAWGISENGFLIVDSIRRKKAWCLQDFKDVFFETPYTMNQKGMRCVRVEIQMIDEGEK